MPVANRDAAARLQATRAMQLQSSVASAPSSGATGEAPVTKSAIQAAGAQQAQAAGQIAVDSAKQDLSATQGAAQVAAQNQATADAERLGQRRLVLAETSRKNESRLATLDRDVKQKLFDSRMEFRRDELGRARLNEAQLADWTVQQSKSENEFRLRMQTMEQAHKQRMALLEVAHAKIAEQLEFESRKRMQDRDQATYERLARAKHNLEMKIQQEQAEAANRQAMWGAAGTVAGAGVGAAVGGPAGAGVGASAGGALATGLSSAFGG